MDYSSLPSPAATTTRARSRSHSLSLPPQHPLGPRRAPQLPNAVPSRPATAMSIGARTFSGARANGAGRASTICGGGAGGGGRTDIDDGGGEWVVAVIQGRVQGIEIGIASHCLTTSITHLTQLSDNQTFSKTIHHLSLHSPVHVVVPDTFLPLGAIPSGGLMSAGGKGRGGWNRKFGGGNRVGGYANGQAQGHGQGQADEANLLVRCLEDRFDLECAGVERKRWDRNEGLDILKKYLLEDDHTMGVLMAADKKYYALSALAALFHYLDHTLGIDFSARSQRMTYVALEGTMFIDPETAKNLELIRSALNPRSSKSLYGVMDVMQTKMAKRLLRSTILQPSIEPAIVEGRLEVVEELMHSEEIYKGLKAGLKAYQNMDLEKLIGQLSQMSRNRDPRAAETRLAQLLQLRAVVQKVGPMIEALVGSRSELLIRASQLLSDDRCRAIEELLDTRINDDAISHQGKFRNQKALRIYAIRANFNKLLDVAREAHKDNESDIYMLRDVLAAEYDLPLELRLNEKGFEFYLKADHVVQDIPAYFTGVRKVGAKIHFTCADLMKQNARMKSSEDEVFLMSDEIVTELRDGIVEHIACLYNVSEALAKLDMLVGFAQIAIEHGYCRPEFKESLAIKDGRHPILERTLQNEPCVPNNTFIEEKSSSFLLIQGPNMSGKSTYLRQVALLTVMALCGSFVPAGYACFRYHDALLSRLSNDDSIEKSLSTFAVEMATSAMILGLATERSLVLIDELGRGTAPSEGAGMAHAIAEELIRRKSFVLFATHFKELAETLVVYPSVEVMHLYTKRRNPSNKLEHGLVYEHKIVRGQLKEEHYGLELAKIAALPEAVLKKALSISEILQDQENRAGAGSEVVVRCGRRKVLMSLQNSLNTTLLHSSLPPTSAALRQHLMNLQKEAVQHLLKLKKMREEGLRMAREKEEAYERGRAGEYISSGAGPRDGQGGSGNEEIDGRDECDESESERMQLD